MQETLPKIVFRVEPGTFPRHVINNIESLEVLLRDIYTDEMLTYQEYVCVVYFNNQNASTGWSIASIGGRGAALVDPKIVFGGALSVGASSIAVAHNHPSGELKASKYDIEMAANLKAASEVLALPILDNVIITEGGIVSI